LSLPDSPSAVKVIGQNSRSEWEIHSGKLKAENIFGYACTLQDETKAL